MKRLSTGILFLLAAFLALNITAIAQKKKKKAPVKKTTAKKTVETPSAPPPVKKNERPAEQTTSEVTPQEPQGPQKKNQADRNAAQKKPAEIVYPYKYEFWQPDFVVSRYTIEHDEKGKGKIVFEKKEADEPITDPVQLSEVTLERLNAIFTTLNFIDSNEDYQSKERQYAHLGTNRITLRKDGKERAAEYNWSENKDAKALADEYRKIGEQYIWMFDMSVSLENQPLEAPGLMDRLESLIRRNEISDPEQMVPLLKNLSDDERIPLIARNHAKRIVKDIEKKKEKEK